MDALLADSPTVPGLLTEYILKGECKAASDIYTSGSDVCNLTVCKESQFYSLPFGQAVDSMY